MRVRSRLRAVFTDLGGRRDGGRRHPTANATVAIGSRAFVEGLIPFCVSNEDMRLQPPQDVPESDTLHFEVLSVAWE